MEVTTGTVVKGTAIVGGSVAGGYGVSTLITKQDSNTEDNTQQQTEGTNSDDQSTPTVTPNTEAEPDTTPKFLFQKTSFWDDTSEYKKSGGTFGYAFGRFMLDPDENTELWKTKEQTLKAAESESLSGEFKKLKESNDGSKKLKDVCSEVYKKQKSEVLTSNISDLTNYNTWIHCAIATHQPYTVNKNTAEKSKYTGKWAKEEKNDEALFGITSNDKPIWDHIYKNILKKDIDNTSKQGSINSEFKSITSGDGLRTACEKAYNTDATETDNDNYGTNVREYCVLDISIELKKYPTKT